jgi:hypothetical protein
MPAIRRRTTTKLLRLYPEELADITARAKRCGLKPARFIREAALGPMPKARRHAETDRLLRALARLGGRLEQAARRARSSGDAALAEQVATALDGHHALVAEMVALRASRRPRVVTTSQTIGASRRRARGRPTANGQRETSGDQLMIDFDRTRPAASVRMQAATRR